ncbi:MAG: hypothetical protein J0M11_03840 [Anaerolineae bacterium]|nr:hypothetical protein [Anaerolineae bacterium]
MLSIQLSSKEEKCPICQKENSAYAMSEILPISDGVHLILNTLCVGCGHQRHIVAIVEIKDSDRLLQHSAPVC